MTTIYKICAQASWREAEGCGLYRGSDADMRDGFIHFSTAAQVAGTAAQHFARQTDLMLVAVDGEAPADVIAKVGRIPGVRQARALRF